MRTPETTTNLTSKQQSSDGPGNSKLKLEVFAVRKLRRNKAIGELEEKIETLLVLDDSGGGVSSSSPLRGY